MVDFEEVAGRPRTWAEASAAADRAEGLLRRKSERARLADVTPFKFALNDRVTVVPRVNPDDHARAFSEAWAAPAHVGETGVVTGVLDASPYGYRYRVQFPLPEDPPRAMKPSERLFREAELVPASVPAPPPPAAEPDVPDVPDVLAEARRAIEYVRDCRDTHEGWTEADVRHTRDEAWETPAAAVVAFHEETLAGYDKALAALEGLYGRAADLRLRHQRQRATIVRLQHENDLLRSEKASLAERLAVRQALRGDGCF